MPIKLIASDLDGTLIDHNNFIPVDNLNAINDLEKKKIDFAICTRKNLFHDKRYLQKMSCFLWNIW